MCNGEPSSGNTNETSADFYISDFIEFQVTPWFRNADFLRQKYVVESLSTEQIAGMVGSARTTVSRYLKVFKIPLRTQDEATRLRKANLAYGGRLQDGKIVPCKREQEVIVMIQKLRGQGMGLQAIADFLNSMAIPTKSKKAKWKTATVWYLSKREGASTAVEIKTAS